jgi:sulfite reductase alpha subunit-like flavoprotein
MAFDEYNIFELPTEKLVVFIVATTGDGDPPTTMINAWRFLLRKDLPPMSLANLRFTVFGLGDSSYDKFNAMAKKLTQRLLDLGAQLFHKIGLGDYQHDFEYEGEFDPWMKLMWSQLQNEIKNKQIAVDLSE